GDLLIGEVFRLPRVPEKAGRDQQQAGGSEKEPTFPFQARLAQQTLERPIGHGNGALRSTKSRNFRLQGSLAAGAEMRGTTAQANALNGSSAARAWFPGLAVDAELFLVFSLQARNAHIIANARTTPPYRSIQ